MSLNKLLDQKIVSYLEKNKDNIFADVDKVLRVPSVDNGPEGDAPFGRGVADALDTMLGICTAHGLKTRNIDNMVGDATYGDGKESLGILAHMDVVPEGTGWTKPPFALTREGGMLYGRGVGDDKGPAVGALWALLAALDAGVKLNKKVVLIFGGDEESGMRCLKRYLETEPAPDMAFSPDAAFPVIHCEKTVCHGTFTAKLPAESALKGLSGGTRSNVVPSEATALISAEPKGTLPEGIETAREGGLWRLSAHGVSAHGSTPEKGDNAIIKLLGALMVLLPAGDPALDTVAGLHKLCAAHDGSGFGIACRDEVSGPLTFNLGVISVEGGVINGLFDVRHPSSINPKRNIEVLLPAAANSFGIGTKDITVSPGFCVPKDHVLVRTLMGIYNEVHGGNEAPIAIGGGTYARVLPCAVAYGMLFPEDEETAHMADERVSEETFLKAVRIYAHAIAELAK